MKNFEKRLAEIQLRGEELKRRHKTRQLRILLACMPLVLCIFLYAGIVLPAMMPAGAAPENAGGAPESVTEMMDVSGIGGVSVWVENSQTSMSYSVHEEAKTVEALLREITTVYKSTSAQDPATPTEQADGTTDGTDKTEGIIISAVLSNGTQCSYLLLEDALQDTKTGKVYPMTPQQARQLKQLIQEASQ